MINEGIKDISKYKSVNIFLDSESFTDYTVLNKLEEYNDLEGIKIYEIYKWERKSKVLPIIADIKYDWEDKFTGSIKLKSSKWESWHIIQSYDNIKTMSKWIFGNHKKCLCDMTEKISISAELWKYPEESISIFLTQDTSIIENTHKIYPIIKGLAIINNILSCEEILWLYLRSKWSYYLSRNEGFSYVVNYGYVRSPNIRTGC